MKTWDTFWSKRNTPPMEDNWCQIPQLWAHTHEFMQKHSLLKMEVTFWFWCREVIKSSSSNLPSPYNHAGHRL